VSYDISIEAPPDKGFHSQLWETNVTYNLAPMLKAAGLRFDDLDGMTGREAQPHVASALHWLLDHPAEARTLAPENGWGTFDGLLACLAWFTAGCSAYPDGIVRVD